MAHHQHHGADYDAQVSRSLQARPASSTAHMPIISEDDLLADPDEPPEPHLNEQLFTKSHPSTLVRRQSLLTKGLSTDTESQDENPMPEAYFGHLPSVSSTASNFSSRSTGDFTSDDGHHSPSTRASTPSSPRSVTNVPKILLGHDRPSVRYSSPQQHDSDSSRKSSGEATPEPTVEAQLGRKRCITFACGRKDTPAAKVVQPAKAETAAPAKRPCSIRFVCPFTAMKEANTEFQRTSRHLSPAPMSLKTDSPRGFHRRHRDSDSTIKNESPKTSKATPTPASARRVRRASNNSDLGRSQACRFAEFANSDEDVEEWTRESTCHMSRLTVTDTLKKENDIRQLAEEADEEEALEEANELDDIENDDDEDDDSSDEVSDAGFQTDDEEGFAESDDDENGSDSDYEWWAPRQSRAASPFVRSDVFRPVVQRRLSDSSNATSDDEEVVPMVRRGRQRLSKRFAVEIPVRPGTPELPDSTDFVCGTLDEDRPLEQAYMSCLHQRQAAKHRTVPQDIDPSFPTSDPEIENDDEDVLDKVDESDHLFMHGRLDNINNREEPRGRRNSPAPLRSPPPPAKKAQLARSPAPAKKAQLPRSPAPAKKAQLPRSPAPRGLFTRSSPRRFRSPAPGNRMTSPPPSRRGSTTRLGAGPLKIDLPFLGERNANLTHTASLPRSPHPFGRRKLPSAMCPETRTHAYDDEEDDEGEATEHGKPFYTRGAIDIAQGLECKRLKRREKFYRQYLKKEEKKKSQRPQPGKGAHRMRQVGLECATLRGKRMLSI